MNELNLAEFVPAMAELKSLAERAKGVDVKNIDQVHNVRIELRDTRISIAKKGKELREGALNFQKTVISKEKELLAIIEPEETRLDEIESRIKLAIEMETRRVELPTRIAGLASIGDSVAISDDDLLKMDNNEFNTYRLQRIEAKLVSDKWKYEEEKRIESEKADKERRDKLAKEEIELLEKRKIEEEKLAKEKAEILALRKIDEDKLQSERQEIEKEKARLQGIEEQRIKEEQLRKNKITRLEQEKKLKEEKEKARLQEEKFNNFLTKSGYNKNTDKIEGNKIWRLIAEYHE